MKEAEKDLLTIKRDALLRKKRLLDFIEKLRQDAPQNQTQFFTTCSSLVKVTGLQEFSRLKDFLSSIETKNALTVKVSDTLGGLNWGSYKVDIKIRGGFDGYYENISKEYHELNKTLAIDKKPSETDFWVYYTNPFWLITRLLRFLWRRKALSLLVILVSLLFYDYSLAWKNLTSIIKFVLSNT